MFGGRKATAQMAEAQAALAAMRINLVKLQAALTTFATTPSTDHDNDNDVVGKVDREFINTEAQHMAILNGILHAADRLTLESMAHAPKVDIPEALQAWKNPWASRGRAAPRSGDPVKKQSAALQDASEDDDSIKGTPSTSTEEDEDTIGGKPFADSDDEDDYSDDDDEDDYEDENEGYDGGVGMLSGLRRTR